MSNDGAPDQRIGSVAFTKKPKRPELSWDFTQVAENTRHWEKDHCAFDLQFNKIGFDQIGK